MNDLNEIVKEMRLEATKLGACSVLHDRRGNSGAADVAHRAQELLARFAWQLERVESELDAQNAEREDGR